MDNFTQDTNNKMKKTQKNKNKEYWSRFLENKTAEIWMIGILLCVAAIVYGVVELFRYNYIAYAITISLAIFIGVNLIFASVNKNPRTEDRVGVFLMTLMVIVVVVIVPIADYDAKEGWSINYNITEERQSRDQRIEYLENITITQTEIINKLKTKNKRLENGINIKTFEETIGLINKNCRSTFITRHHGVLAIFYNSMSVPVEKCLGEKLTLDEMEKSNLY